MRDERRIFRVTQKLATLWRSSGEDLRFFQLLSNLGFDNNKDWFYFEDDRLEEFLNKQIEKHIRVTQHNNQVVVE